MTEKVRNVISLLSLRVKVGIVLALVVLSFTSSIVIAFAAGGISFSGQSPANGSIIGNPQPNILVNASVAEGELITEDVKMKFDNEEVSPSVTAPNGNYQISYAPSAKLKDGNYTVSVDVYDSLKEAYDSTNWTFTIDAAPNPSGWTPAKNSTITASNPKVSLYVKDSYDELDNSSLQVTLDGTAVPAKFDFPGHYETYTYGDSCTGWSETVWIIDSYKEGTVSLNASGLSSGSHTVNVRIADKAGNVLDETWTFNRDSLAPIVVSLTPADGTTSAAGNPFISAAVKDGNYDLNSGSATLRVDDIVVPSGFKFKGYENYDTCSGDYLGYVITSRKEGTFNYQAPVLSDGLHTAELTIANVNGDVLTRKWSFTIGVQPVLSNLTPAGGTEAKTVTVLSFKVSDANLDPATIVVTDNKIQIPHVYDAATGTVTYNGGFSYGKHEVIASAADSDGNKGTAKWTFIVDDKAPDVEANPVVNITDGVLRFNAILRDLVDITPETILKLDNQIIPAQISYDMNIDTCTGDILGIKSKKLVTVDYQSVIPDGTHTLTMTRGDVLGNAGTLTWNLNVVSKPKITQWKPVTYISELQPIISANIKDGNNILDISAIAMTLDGKAIAPGYNPTTGNLSYTPEQPLTNESYHTVTLSAYDPGGLSDAITWKFNINTYPDMADSNMMNCSACHEVDVTAPIPFQSIHKNVNFYGSHSDNRCDACHNYITYPADCYQCHGDDGGGSDAPHGSSPGIDYKLKNYDTYYPMRVTDNREMWDCVICHQPGSPVLGWYWARVQPTRVLNNHDIPELHKATESSCNKCHAQSLTREHARQGRVDNSGNPINCNTCHKSQDPLVLAAISGKVKDCAACHGNADHESIHTSGLDGNCQTCHSKGLTTEHLNNPTTDGKGYTCDTCHNNQGNEVKRTIVANSLNCAGCHQTGHNLYFADSVPADIPVYPDYLWTTPIEAAIFAGENNTPVGYDSGQVVITSRRNDINADQVLDFYIQQMSSNGWHLKSEQPAEGATAFSVEFEKEGRFTTVKCFNTTLSDGTGPLSSGYRIEIWYK